MMTLVLLGLLATNCQTKSKELKSADLVVLSILRIRPQWIEGNPPRLHRPRHSF